MILIIGGFSQGKLNYVKEKYNIKKENIFNYRSPYIFPNDEIIVFNRFNDTIIESIKMKIEVKDIINNIIKEYPKAIIISDEVGNGIVPIDKDERFFREEIGRAQIQIAQNSDEVIRVVCGIGQKIK